MNVVIVDNIVLCNILFWAYKLRTATYLLRRSELIDFRMKRMKFAFYLPFAWTPFQLVFHPGRDNHGPYIRRRSRVEGVEGVVGVSSSAHASGRAARAARAPAGNSRPARAAAPAATPAPPAARPAAATCCRSRSLQGTCHHIYLLPWRTSSCTSIMCIWN